MFQSSSFIQLLLAVGSSAFVVDHETRQSYPSPPKVQSVSTVYQASAPKAWIENLAVRSNGNVVFDRLDVPQTWQYNPSTHGASLVSTYPNQTGAVGIAEYAPDVFGVIAGNFSLANLSASSNWNIWSLNFSQQSTPQPKVIVNIKEAKLLNGATALSNGVFLAGDAVLGAIFSVNTAAKTYKIASQDATLSGSQTALGVNGIKVHGSWLYYTNDNLKAVYRMPISLVDGSQAGPAQLFASNLTALDDLILDTSGNVYVCQNSLNVLTFIPAAGNHSQPFVGGLNSTTIAGDTAVAFGRGSQGSNVLYVTTSGAQTGPVNGTFTEPGKLVQINLQSS